MTRRQLIILITILVVGAALRAAFSFGFADSRFFLQADGRDYADLSANLASGKGYSISFYRWFEPKPPGAPALHAEIYRPPLVPLVGAGLHFVALDCEVAARIACIAIGTLCILMVYLLAARLISPPAGLLAAAATAIYPYAIFHSAQWSTEGLFTLLLLTMVWALAELIKTSRARWALMGGLAAGLATLARPNGLLIGVGMIAWIVLLSGLPLRRRMMAAGLFILTLAAVLTPWTIRNYRLSGIATPATAFGPYNFWMGNNQRMYTMYQLGHAAEFRTQMDRLYDQDSAAHVRHLQESGIFEPREINEYWTRQGLDYMRKNPGQAASIWLHRAGHYWRPWPNYATTSRNLFWLSGIVVSPIFLLGAAGLWSMIRRSGWSRGTLIAAVPMLGFLGALPFVFHLRLRYPTVDLFAIILAAVACLELWRRLRPSQTP